MAFERYEHEGGAAAGQLASNISSSATSIPLGSGEGSGWPDGSSGNEFWVTLGRGTSNEEHVLCDGRTTDTLSLASSAKRGLDGTSAVSHAAGTVVEHGLSAAEVDDANASSHRVLNKGIPQALMWTFTDATNPTFTPAAGVEMPAAGSVIGISLGLNQSLSAGTLAAEAAVQGSGTGLTATVDSGAGGQAAQYDSAGQALGADTFTAGQLVAPTLTPSSASPDADGIVVVWVVVDAFV